jgi:hypothetical protein
LQPCRLLIRPSSRAATVSCANPPASSTTPSSRPAAVSCANPQPPPCVRRPGAGTVSLPTPSSSTACSLVPVASPADLPTSAEPKGRQILPFRPSSAFAYTCFSPRNAVAARKNTYSAQLTNLHHGGTLSLSSASPCRNVAFIRAISPGDRTG